MSMSTHSRTNRAMTLTPQTDTYTFCTGSMRVVNNKGRSTKPVFARLLRTKLLYYSKNPSPPPIASIDIRAAAIDKVHDIDRRTFSITVARVRYVFRAKRPDMRDRWVNGLRNQQSVLDDYERDAATSLFRASGHAVFQGELEHQEKERIVVYEAPRGVVNIYKTDPFDVINKEKPLGTLELRDAKLAWESAAEFKAASGSFLFSVSPAQGEASNSRTVFVTESAEQRERWMSALACVIHAVRVAGKAKGGTVQLDHVHSKTFGREVVSSIASLKRSKPPPRPSKLMLQQRSGGGSSVTGPAVPAGNTRQRVSFLQRALARSPFGGGGGAKMGSPGGSAAPPKSMSGASVDPAHLAAKNRGPNAVGANRPMVSQSAAPSLQSASARARASKLVVKQNKQVQVETVEARHDLRALEVVKQMTVPTWVPDSTYSECIQCRGRLRAGERHHCRLCGHMFCSRCTHKFTVPDRFRKKSKKGPVHVCFGCDYRARGDPAMITEQGKSAMEQVNFDGDENHELNTIFLSQWDNPALYAGCYECGKGGKGQNCRACGHLFCNSCVSKQDVPNDFRAYNKPGGVPVCDRCRFRIKGSAKFVASYRSKDKMPLLRIRAPSIDDQERVSSHADSRFFSKLNGDNCSGCQAAFGFFLRRHKCFHCAEQRFWCKKCLRVHQDLLPQDLIEQALIAGNVASRKATARGAPPAAPTPSDGTMSKYNTVEESPDLPPTRGTAVSHAVSAAQASAAASGSGTAGHTASTTANEPDVVSAPDLQPEAAFTARYEMQSRLGEGSYGAVFKALDRTDGCSVAVKVLDCRSGEKNTAESLAKEINFMRDCDSPYIVRLKGAYNLSEKVGIVMEYCDAGSISDMMEICDVTMAESQLAVIMRETLKGLAYLHENGKVHRDIKSGNILLDKEGECKLADFGVSANLKKEGKRYTMIGTPYWMAPEVLKPTTTTEGYTEKVDIWALGITAFELAKGVPPLSDIHPMRAILKIPYNAPPCLPDPENFSAEFIEFLALCLDKNPATRPSAKQLLKSRFIKKAGKKKVLLSLVKECVELIESFRADEAALAEEARETMVDGGTTTASTLLRGVIGDAATGRIGTGYISSTQPSSGGAPSTIGFSSDDGTRTKSTVASQGDVAPPPPPSKGKPDVDDEVEVRGGTRKLKAADVAGTTASLAAVQSKHGSSLTESAAALGRTVGAAASGSQKHVSAATLYEMSTLAYPSGKFFEAPAQESVVMAVTASMQSRKSVVSDARSRRATRVAEGDNGTTLPDDPELAALVVEMEESCAHLGINEDVQRILLRKDLKLASLPKGLSLADLNTLLPLLMKLQAVYRRLGKVAVGKQD